METRHSDPWTSTLAQSQTRRSALRLLGAALLGSGGLSLLSGNDSQARPHAKRGKGQARHQKHHDRDDAAEAEKKRPGGGGNGGNGGGTGGGGTPPPAGSVFTVRGRDILDPNGNPVLLRGVNKMVVFDDEDPKGALSFPEIAKTGANTVRIVWLTSADPGRLAAVLTNAIDAGLLPMVELHDATGDWNGLGKLVDYWTRPQVAEILAAHQDKLLVNIGNEVGDDQVSKSTFIDGYTKAVRRMRNAGIHTPLVIDAPDWGKNLDVLNATAATLLEADPDHNLIFSVHLYWGIADGADAAFIRDALDNAAAQNYPLIVGEFSEYGAYNGSKSICAEGGRIDYQTILKETQRLGIGWYAWEWGPGNGYNDPKCDVMDMTSDRRFASLKAGWATEVATNSPYSIKKTAKPIL